MNASLTPCGGDAFECGLMEDCDLSADDHEEFCGGSLCELCAKAVEGGGKCGEIFMPVPHDRERMAGILEVGQ